MSIVVVERLPRADEGERCLLGAVLRYPERADELLPLVAPRDFFDEYHQQIWTALRTHHRQGGIDLARLRRELKPTHSASGDLTEDYFDELIDSVTTSAHSRMYADQIIEARRKRQLFGIVDHARHESLNGQTADQVYRLLSADLDDYRCEAVAVNPQFPLVSAMELATATFTLRYLIDRVLVEGQPCILGGPKKSLKTTLAVLLAIHLALGIPLFGKFEISRRCRVLAASAESGLATIQDIARRICNSLGVDLADIDNLAFVASVPKPHDVKSWVEFRAVVQDYAPDVLILDPFYRMIPGDGAESIFKMGVVLGTIDDLCQEFGITLILCHHLKTSRLNPFAPAELDDLAYAGCAEYFRQWLLLSRREAYTPGTGHHPLWATIGGSAGHNSLWGIDIDEGSIDAPGGRNWSANLYRADEARDHAEQRKAEAKAAAEQKVLDADREKVCRLMVKHPAGATKTFIRDHCAVSSRRWPATFAAMYDAGELETCDVTVSNHKTPTTGYRLNTEYQSQ